jgi:hypothetical protein
MTSEQADYTDFDVIASAVKEGMAPFKPRDIIVEVERTFIGDIKVIVTVTNLPLMGTSYVIDESQLVKPDAGDQLKSLGQKLYNFFRQLSIEPEANIELGEE